MSKLDNKFTNQLQDWLNTPAPDRDLMQGAMLLLQLNRNRAFYNTVIRRPEKYADKLEYELRKFLKMRIDNMAAADVVAMREKVLPRVAKSVESLAVVDTDAELPQASKAVGKRADHDSLPKHIQDLWDKNLDVFRRVKLLYNECCAMTDAKAQPCDIYEKLKLLDEADRKYRANLAEYDAFVVGSVVDQPAPSAEKISPDDQKRMAAARKTLSKYRTVFAKTVNETTRANALAKMQQCVNTIKQCKGGFTDETIAALTAIGIVF